ncbi:SLC13 family permease [Hyphomonas sp. NPDC076900]|uniref:SLC13 family permease n=1 Tax=unclassified Hyphomonas TaxID=2630699 RepID=UPI003D082F13
MAWTTTQFSCRIRLIAGPGLAILIYASLGLLGLDTAARNTAAIMGLMAVWWATETLPVAVTALLPIVLFPLCAIMPIAETASAYASSTIFLFMGGFIVALAIERSGLHRRIALGIISITGLDGRALTAGFMLAAAFLSMWISNTSTTLMLLPIALSVIDTVEREHRLLPAPQRSGFRSAMLLGLAYGASIGGMATLIGTPPNAFLAAFIEAETGEPIGFAQWMLVGLPVTMILLPLCWLFLTRVLYKIDFRVPAALKKSILDEIAQPERWSSAEKRVAGLFVVLVVGWLLREQLRLLPGLASLSDTAIAIAVAILAFIIPDGEREGALLNWDEANRLPWGVLLLFGGGLALADGMSSSGLTIWIGEQLAPLTGLHLTLLVGFSVLLVIFLTEVTSNLATTAAVLPVMAALAEDSSAGLMILLVPVTLSASCAFMFPVATPPNAIVYGAGGLRIAAMMRAGIVLNLIAAGVLVLVATGWVGIIF